jgi:DMSO/TMAO reductase YedYZ molybdopterin-dependent catalytic subunit
VLERSPSARVSGALEIITEEPLCAEVPLSALDTWITPSDRYFIRSHFPVPVLKAENWRLIVEGDVERRVVLGFSELRGLAHRRITATMECAGNSRAAVQPPAEGVPWGNGALGTARWSGVSLAEVLALASPRVTAREVMFEGADRGSEPEVSGELPFAMSVPLEKALEPDTLLAWEMNGEPLTPSHGYPVRAIVPDWYGMASVKWITRIEVLSSPFEGFFRTHPYVFIHEGDDPAAPRKPVTRLLVKSLITSPKEGSVLPPGRHLLRGVAWSGEGPIVRVQVSQSPVGGDDRPELWTDATILAPRAAHTWVRWEHPVELRRPGYYLMRARATDDRGNVQPLRADWNFRGVGTNSIHPLPLIVRNEAPATIGPARAGP